MDDARKQALFESIQNAGHDPAPYSGRGMYGKECLSFVTDSDPFRGLADIIEVMNGLPATEIAAIVRGVKSDNMGLGTVLYWPKASTDGLSFPRRGVDQDEDEEDDFPSP
jgi:hypothetical protein